MVLSNIHCNFKAILSLYFSGEKQKRESSEGTVMI